MHCHAGEVQQPPSGEDVNWHPVGGPAATAGGQKAERSRNAKNLRGNRRLSIKWSGSHLHLAVCRLAAARRAMRERVLILNTGRWTDCNLWTVAPALLW